MRNILVIFLLLIPSSLLCLTQIGSLFIFCISIPTSAMLSIPYSFISLYLSENGHLPISLVLDSYEAIILPVSFTIQYFSLFIFFKSKKSKQP